MDPITLGAIIGGGTGLIGGLVGQSAADDRAAASNEAARREAALNREMQKEFAQHGIKWRVQDAMNAGIHPIYALGANTHSFTPVSVGDSQPQDFIGPAIANMGQDISRAVSATKTAGEKELAALQIATAKAQLQGVELDNATKAKALANVGAGAPAFPGSDNFIPGQGNSGTVKINPSERVASQRGRLAQDAGWVPDVGYARTDTGFTPVPSKDVKERIEDQIVPEMMWAARNYFVPNIGAAWEKIGLRPRDEYRGAPPRSQLPKGAKDWSWSFWRQEWQPVY